MQALLSFLFPKKPFLTEEEEQRITVAIADAEKKTSGEIRIYIESRCSYMNPLDRAQELFYQLNMHETKERNGVLLYLATKDHQLAVYGGQGIHEKVGTDFWNQEIRQILQDFKAHHFADGIVHIVADLGDALTSHFPYDKEDKNELPDNIVFGK
jgi:uncharacterized membrane protein